MPGVAENLLPVLLRTLQVPEEIHKMYMEGGRSKTKLLKMLVDSGFDKDIATGSALTQTI